MTGIERRHYEMFVRVRNFGETHRALFESSPVAQQMFAAVQAAIDDLASADMQKMAASATARAGDRQTTGRTLRELLQNIAQLARTLRAAGRSLPGFDLPRSKSALALLTAGRQFATEVSRFEPDFAGHGMGAAHLVTTTAAFEAAMNRQGSGRTAHVAARARIRGLVSAAMHCVRRLDLIVANDLRQDDVIQAQWTQLRRLEDPRASRPGHDSGGSQPAAGTEPAVSNTAS